MAKSKEQADIPAAISAQDAKRCKKAKDAVDKILLEQCKRKHKQLLPCCECSPNHSGPRIRSQQDAVLLNTAYDGAGGTLAQNSLDLQWEYSNSPTGPWNPATVVTNAVEGAWTGTLPPTSDWISIDNDARPPAGQHGNWYFRVRFVLCDGIDPASFALTVNYLVDDRVRDIIVNGISQNSTISIPQSGFTGTPASVTLRNSWMHCENDIIFHINSPGGPLGLAAGFTIDELNILHPCDCECRPAEIRRYEPCFSVSYGSRKGDCLDTNDCQTLCITACNCYSNLTFEDLTINQITVCDEFGNPVPQLPDGRDSVLAAPIGPVCFGDLGPCVEGRGPKCKARQFVLKTHSAKAGRYRLKFEGICYKVSFVSHIDKCFEFELKQD